MRDIFALLDIRICTLRRQIYLSLFVQSSQFKNSVPQYFQLFLLNQLVRSKEKQQNCKQFVDQSDKQTDMVIKLIYFLLSYLLINCYNSWYMVTKFNIYRMFLSFMLIVCFCKLLQIPN
ncbi:transmembrane protein, putative (macronuclear) [Tetrahymena thermophila SB210]|uniref:Transmembrane protein, putative n=1 Tax=Tetrahymena thermophila (strain SB210) TaxID=312017 RepID=W7WW77_TETTS|nr:transmembrane protein, putative [Tetrahymena thermophila SB210]EWS71090.1 transmembrane protein, putative [Tetrahymena thermophila SB210]|eukprot:XP_012656389.1 transmembrane protein, putative [Tetrahymena thermophila SB210]